MNKIHRLRNAEDNAKAAEKPLKTVAFGIGSIGVPPKRLYWIPAFAGMTRFGAVMNRSIVTKHQDCGQNEHERMFVQ